jgi:hypothetical protein
MVVTDTLGKTRSAVDVPFLHLCGKNIMQNVPELFDH